MSRLLKILLLAPSGGAAGVVMALLFSEDFDWKDERDFYKKFGESFNWKEMPVMLPIFSEDFAGWP